MKWAANPIKLQRAMALAKEDQSEANVKEKYRMIGGLVLGEEQILPQTPVSGVKPSAADGIFVESEKITLPKKRGRKSHDELAGEDIA